MVDVPPEAAIRATIRPGSVYYFVEESFKSTEPHYFIVINNKPLEDKVVLLVCASSQIDKVRQRRKTCPEETLVYIDPTRYSDFSGDSIVDCNSIHEKTVEQLVDKLARDELRLKSEMDVSLIEQFRQGVLTSHLIEHRIKKSLQR